MNQTKNKTNRSKEIVKLLMKDINENEIKNLMDQSVNKFDEVKSLSQIDQVCKNWKEKVTSSVLSNFTSSSLFKFNEQGNCQNCQNFAHSQGYLPLDSISSKHSQKTICAKDLSLLFINKFNLSFRNEQINNTNISNSNSSRNCLNRRRRHSWTTFENPDNKQKNDRMNLYINHSTKFINKKVSVRTDIKRSKSFPCVSDNHVKCNESINSCSCLPSFQCMKELQVTHVTESESESLNHLDSIISNNIKCDPDVENIHGYKTSEFNNSLHLDDQKPTTSLLSSQHVFYNKSQRDLFISDVINNVQKFAKEKGVLNCSWPKLDTQLHSDYRTTHGYLNMSNKIVEVPGKCKTSNDTQNVQDEISYKNKHNKLFDLKSDNKKRNELEMLFDSLREIRWASNITAKSLLMETKMRRQSVRLSGDFNNAKSSSRYKRILPNRTIHKVEGIKKQNSKRKECSNNLNSSHLLSSKILLKPKRDTKSVTCKPKDSSTKRLSSPQKNFTEKTNLKHNNITHKDSRMVQCNVAKLSAKLANSNLQSLQKEQRIVSSHLSAMNSVKKSVSSCALDSSSIFKCDSVKESELDNVSTLSNSRKHRILLPAVSSDCSKNNLKAIQDNLPKKNIVQNDITSQTSAQSSENKLSTIAEVFSLSNCPKQTDKEEQLTFGTLRIQGCQTQPQNNFKPPKRKLNEESNCLKLPHREFTLHYKSINVKRNSSYTQVMFKFSGSRHNFLSIEDMVELKETLDATVKDPNCKVLLLSGSNNQFCSGLDLQPLIQQRKERVADEMAKAVKELIEALAAFTKPLVIAVNGSAMGLGVTLLTYSDIVLASDSATFSMPYSQLGYMPEGAGTLTLPQVMGITMAADMLIRGQKLTAHQAQNHGLVSEVIQQNHLMKYVIPRVVTLAKQPLHAMEATKSMMRCHLWEKLQLTLEKELQLLPKQWLSTPCQQAIQNAFSNGVFSN